MSICRACVHGALPWRAVHDRRVLLMRFNPGFMSHGPSAEIVSDVVYPSYFNELSEEQREIMRVPSLARRSTNYRVDEFGRVAPRL